MIRVPQSFKDKYRTTYFNPGKIILSPPKYVAWLDIMGAGELMRVSHVSAAIAIGHFHSIVLLARDTLQFTGEIYPLVDGIYITSENRHQIQSLIKLVFKLSAVDFIIQEKFSHLRIIRGSISFGQVIDGSILKEASNILSDNFAEHTGKVLLGAPLALAYKAENSAAPFGVWVDESARQFCPPGGRTIRCTNWPWWSYPSYKDDVDADCEDIEKMLAEKLKEYFSWCKNNSISIMYDPTRMADHRDRANQYFPSWS